MDPRGLSDASDCTAAVLEDLDGLVFYFLCARSLRFFFVVVELDGSS